MRRHGTLVAFVAILLACCGEQREVAALVGDGEQCPSWAEVLVLARADLLSPTGPTSHPWVYCNGIDDCCDEPGPLDPNEWLSPLAIAEWESDPEIAYADAAAVKDPLRRGQTFAALARQVRHRSEPLAELMLSEAIYLVLRDGRYPRSKEEIRQDLEPTLRQFTPETARRLIDLGWQLVLEAPCYPRGIDATAVFSRLSVEFEPWRIEARLAALIRAQKKSSCESSAALLPLTSALLSRDEQALRQLLSTVSKADDWSGRKLQEALLTALVVVDPDRAWNEVHANVSRDFDRHSVEARMAEVLTSHADYTLAGFVISEISREFPQESAGSSLEGNWIREQEPLPLWHRVLVGPDLQESIGLLELGAPVPSALCEETIIFDSRAQARQLLHAVLHPSHSSFSPTLCPRTLEAVVALLDDPGEAITLALSPNVPDVAPTLIGTYFRAHPGLFPSDWELPRPVGGTIEEPDVSVSERLGTLCSCE